MQQLSARQLADWIAECGGPENDGKERRPKPLLLDVRESWEYELCHLPGSTPMPMSTVPARLQELDDEADVVVICHHGVRSLQVAMFLENDGFLSIYNLAGGVDAWARDVDPGMRQY
ncbi:MAG: rhodanese-like domain-containing protein [Rhodocyclaceae bacterium]